jgi:hypothetical protein
MILEIHEFYEYNVTRNDPKTREGGPFAGYIDTYLKLKAEASLVSRPGRRRTIYRIVLEELEDTA